MKRYKATNEDIARWKGKTGAGGHSECQMTIDALIARIEGDEVEKAKVGDKVWLLVEYLGEEQRPLLPSASGDKLVAFSTGRNVWTLPASEVKTKPSS